MLQASIKILIANDHLLFRQSIKNALRQVAHIEIIEEAVSFPDLYCKLQQNAPDILIVDDIMPDDYLLNALPTIKALYPDLKIIVNTMQSDLGYLKGVVAQVNGLVSLAAEKDDFVKAIETVYYGGFYCFVPGITKTI